MLAEKTASLTESRVRELAGRVHANAVHMGELFDDRTGQYLFPPHTGKGMYGLWDPIYAGPYVATFVRPLLLRMVSRAVSSTVPTRPSDEAPVFA
jgi:hypothetical protein